MKKENRLGMLKSRFAVLASAALIGLSSQSSGSVKSSKGCASPMARGKFADPVLSPFERARLKREVMERREAIASFRAAITGAPLMLTA